MKFYWVRNYRDCIVDETDVNFEDVQDYITFLKIINEEYDLIKDTVSSTKRLICVTEKKRFNVDIIKKYGIQETEINVKLFELFKNNQCNLNVGQILNEDFVTNIDDLVQVLKKRISKSKPLIITDHYFLKTNDEDLREILDVLANKKIKDVKLILSKAKYPDFDSAFDRVKLLFDNQEVTLSCTDSNVHHGRYWFSGKKGFMCDHSINGMRKGSLILKMGRKDIKKIKNHFEN